MPTEAGVLQRHSEVGLASEDANWESLKASGLQLMLLPSVIGFHSRIHNLAPEWREACQHHHGGVTGRKLGCNFMMAQDLVTTLGVGVMVAVTL